MQTKITFFGTLIPRIWKERKLELMIINDDDPLLGLSFYLL